MSLVMVVFNQNCRAPVGAIVLYYLCCIVRVGSTLAAPTVFSTSRHTPTVGVSFEDEESKPSRQAGHTAAGEVARPLAVTSTSSPRSSVSTSVDVHSYGSSDQQTSPFVAASSNEASLDAVTSELHAAHASHRLSTSQAAPLRWTASNASGDPLGACLLQDRASPINIVPHSAVPVDSSIRLQYGVWARGCLQRAPLGSDGRGGVDMHFQGKQGGSIQVGHQLDDHDTYVLRSVRVRAPSEHSFLGVRLPVEVQLWHEPTLEQDLGDLRREHEAVSANLSAVEASLGAWRTELERLGAADEPAPHGNGTRTFPDTQTVEAWMAAVRGRSDSAGAALLEEARRLHGQMREVERRAVQIAAALKRPGASRQAVLSVFFRAGDEPHPEASAFLRWLATEAEAGATATATPPAGGGGPQQEAEGRRHVDLEAEGRFEFARVPYAKGKDVGGVHKAFSYEGSFVEPPCMPVVRWFLVSEPLVALREDILRIVNVTQQPARQGSDKCEGVDCMAGDILGDDVWMDGLIRDVPRRQPALPQRTIHTVVLSIEPFKKSGARLSSDTVSNLPWGYIQFYCGAFLVCSIVMLCTTCLLCSQNCCDK